LETCAVMALSMLAVVYLVIGRMGAPVLTTSKKSNNNQHKRLMLPGLRDRMPR
jgi:hypothetical protein